MKTGLILLAAGNSSRLGKAKQLLEFRGKTLIQRAIDTASESTVDSIVVVLGANHRDIKKGFLSDSVHVVYNTEWEKGMASSIQAGLGYLLDKKKIDQVILMLCDQPFVNAELLDSLIRKKEESGKGSVACSYVDTIGVPVLFDQKYFPEMMSLHGTEGAKKLLVKHRDNVVLVDFPLGAVDVDTMEDYSRLISGEK